MHGCLSVRMLPECLRSLTCVAIVCYEGTRALVSRVLPGCVRSLSQAGDVSRVCAVKCPESVVVRVCALVLAHAGAVHAAQLVV